MLNWEDDVRFVLSGTTFQALAPEAFMHREVPQEGEFPIFKPPSLVERYAALIAELQPQRVLELGISLGGSTAFFAELARPRRLVALDRRLRQDVVDRVERYAADRGLSGAVRIVGEVDQADRPRLAQIVEEEFDGFPLDLVVDDCSHLYEPTRASFNELFPRLRPGGVCVIEDWGWAHNALDSDNPEGWLPQEVPLTRLLFEIELAIPSAPGLIAEISIRDEAAVITRGEAEVDPNAFDISACSNPRGQALLAPTMPSST